MEPPKSFVEDAGGMPKSFAEEPGAATEHAGPAPINIQMGEDGLPLRRVTPEGIEQRRKAGWLPYSFEPELKPQGPGWRDVEIGAREGLQGAALPYAQAAEKIYGGRLAGGKPLSQAMVEQGPSPEEMESRQSLGSKVIQGVARTPFDIARYEVSGGGIAGMAGADALAAAGEQETPEEAATAGLKAGAKGAAMGAALGKLSPYGRGTRIPTAAAIGGGAAALEGGNASDVAAAAITMGGLSGIHGKAEHPVPRSFEPEPPTAAQPTVPESPATLQVQMTQLNQGKRNVVMFPKGTEVPELPHGTAVHQDPVGNTYAYDAEKIKPTDIDAAVASNRLPEILGDAAAGMGAPDKTALQGEPVAVVGRTMDGTTVQATATDEANLQATIDATKKITPPGGTVSVEPAENEIAARQQGEPQPAAAGPVESGIAPPPEPGQEVIQPPEVTGPEAGAAPAPKGAIGQFLSDETGTSALGAILREDVNETRALIAKRQAALADLDRAKNTPEEKDFGQKVLQWFTGERDVWGARINQVIGSLQKMVPDHVDQEALSLMRDFKNKPGELQQWLNGTHPGIAGAEDPALAARNIQRLRPAIERALNPTPQMMAADHILTQIADVSLQEGQRRGFLESSITPDEYVTHLLHPSDKAEFTPLTERAVSKMGGKLGRRFAFAQKRAYPTLLDAVADNVKPRTLNAFDAFTIHGDKFATSRATNMLVDALKDSGVGKWGGRAGTAPGGVPQTNIAGAPGIPADWVEIAPHAHPFQNVMAFADKEGNPVTARQTLFVPKSIEQALRPITDPDYSNKIKGFTRMRMFQAYTKAAQLGLSLFHATTENYMALANMGPKGWARALRADREAPGFREQERDFVLHGGTSPIQGKTYEAYKSLQPGSIPTWGDIWKSLPGVHEMERAADGITRFTFDKLQRQFKITDYSLHKAGWIADHPNATPEQQSKAMQSIAKEINAVYGGLHWENLGVNRMTLNVARAIMLAPDWTLSNLVNLKYATERGTPAGKMARAFWLRASIGGMVATQMLSLAVSRQPSKRLTQVYYGKDKDGQDIYQNVFFKGAPGDVVNLINNVKDFGPLMGLSKSAGGKAAPIPRTALQLITNRDYLGREIVPKGLNPIAATARSVGYATKGMSPVPLSAQNTVDMLFGQKSDKYTTPEVLSTLFAGTPPSHVPPEGMKMTPKGLRIKKERPANSIWQQTWTGKRDLPSPRPLR